MGVFAAASLVVLVACIGRDGSVSLPILITANTQDLGNLCVNGAYQYCHVDCPGSFPTGACEKINDAILALAQNTSTEYCANMGSRAVNFFANANMTYHSGGHGNGVDTVGIYDNAIPIVYLYDPFMEASAETMAGVLAHEMSHDSLYSAGSYDAQYGDRDDPLNGYFFDDHCYGGGPLLRSRADTLLLGAVKDRPTGILHRGAQ